MSKSIISRIRPTLKYSQRHFVKPIQAPYSTSPQTSPFAPRHLLSVADLSSAEFIQIIRNAHSHKKIIKAGSVPKSLLGALTGKTVAMMFNKRSTRTRVSTEGAVATMGGHPMFLGKDDIQLGVSRSRAIGAAIADINGHR
jgi:ornithine carbamoyltransferase